MTQAAPALSPCSNDADLGASIQRLTRDLCAFETGVVASDNAAYFARLTEDLPDLELHRFGSGLDHNGWLVPDAWSVQRATVHANGSLVFNGLDHPLAVATYSRPFHGQVDRKTLLAHTVSNPDLPGAHVYHSCWQYRPWDADWCLCMPHDVVRGLPDGPFDIDLRTTHEPGEMLLATCDIAGARPETIVLNAHTCHPGQANDDNAGVAVLVHLFNWLACRKTRYSYRLVLGPEHLGTVFYLRTCADIDAMVSGVFAEMPGTDGAIKLTSTFLGGQAIDRALAHAAEQCSDGHVCVPWRTGAGNDETVWEAPGYEVPFVEMSRAESFERPFREYHSSLDTADLMNRARLASFARTLMTAIEILERNAYMQRRFDGLVCLSNPRYDLYLERPDPAIAKDLPFDAETWGQLQDSLPRYFDGRTSILDIAIKHGVPFPRLADYLDRFVEKELIDLEPVTIARHPVHRVTHHCR